MRRVPLLLLVVGSCSPRPPESKLIARPPASAIDAGPSVAAKAPPARVALVDLTVGHGRSCATRVDGHVVCWGQSAGMDPPPASSEEPMLLAGVDDAVQVTGNDWSWCARRKDGGVVCWSHPTWKPTPIAISGAVEISDNCARLGDGKVVCWRDGAVETIPGIDNPLRLGRRDGGANCVVRRDKTVACWGQNNWRQLGDGTTTDRETPVSVKGLTGVDEVSAGYFFGTCARAGSIVKCWGGELNKSTGIKDVPGITTAVQIAVAEYHACARLADGTVTCWGSNHNGQLGFPMVQQENPPADAIYHRDTAAVVPGVHDAIDVQVGGGEPCGGCGSTCARTKNGKILCWGGTQGTHVPTEVDPVVAE